MICKTRSSGSKGGKVEEERKTRPGIQTSSTLSFKRGVEGAKRKMGLHQRCVQVRWLWHGAQFLLEGCMGYETRIGDRLYYWFQRTWGQQQETDAGDMTYIATPIPGRKSRGEAGASARLSAVVVMGWGSRFAL
jgi:hypothetical protein